MGLMNEDAVRHLYDLANQIWTRRSSRKLDLFIYSRGGHSDVPWALMSMLRQVIGEKVELDALIPYRCHSAATITVLGADNLVMGKKAELGPIDTTMTTPYNPQHPKTDEPLPVPFPIRRL
jgi:ClpP class serine protease